MKVYCNYSDNSFDDMDDTDFKNIKTDTLKSFAVFNDDGMPIFELFYESNQRPIYRRRTQHTSGVTRVICMIGWQRKIGNENIQSINYIIDGVVVQHGRFNTGLFSEPQWHKYERDDSNCECDGCKNTSLTISKENK